MFGPIVKSKYPKMEIRRRRAPADTEDWWYLWRGPFLYAFNPGDVAVPPRAKFRTWREAFDHFLFVMRALNDVQYEARWLN